MNRRFPCFLSIVLLVGILAPAEAEEKIASYRYRPFDEGERGNWISPFTADTNLPKIEKLDRKGGFEQFWYADFDGDKHYVCSEGIEGNPLSGDFSVQAFFCLPEIRNGRQIICTTVVGREGFRLYIEDGRLKGGCHYKNPHGPEELVEAEAALEAGVWYHVAFVARRKQADNVNELSLWINSEKVAENVDIPVSRAIENSTKRPIFGADVSANPAGTLFHRHLVAKVHAVEIFDYALSDFYLESKVIRDGSRYFGIPSYHDYLNEGNVYNDKRPLEQRIMDTYEQENLAAFRERLQDRFFLPFLNDNYIPQGITSDPENERLFISYYHKDKDGNKSRPSIVAEILMPSGTLGNVFVLDEKDEEDNREDDDNPWSHVGGIAYWDGCLFVPDGPDLLLFDLSVDSDGNPVVPSSFDPLRMTGFAPITLERTVRWENLVKTGRGEDNAGYDIAFIDIHEDSLTGQPVLALGDYTSAKDQLDDNEDGVLSPAEFGGRAKGSCVGEVVFFRPSRIISREGEVMIFLSPLGGINEAYLYTQGIKTYFDSPTRQRAFYSVTGNRVPEAQRPEGKEYSPAKFYHANYESGGEGLLPNASERALVCYTPRGNEDLALYGGKLWTPSESGAKYLQKKEDDERDSDDGNPRQTHYNDPWTQLFPFLFSISVDDYFEAVPNEIPILEDTTLSVPENSPAGTVVGTLRGRDANHDPLTYSVFINANPNRNELSAFRIEGDKLVVNDSGDLDHETEREFTIRVVVNDGVSISSGVIEVSVGDDRNEDADGDGLTEAEEEDAHGTSDTNVDSDGDGFLDGDEVERNTDPADPASRLLADSVLEFSGEQGQDDWYHGYRNYTLDGGGGDYDPDADFIAFATTAWRGTEWRLPNQGGAPWTLLGRASTHPNGTNSAPNEEHWTVRRWVPTDLEETTPVAITWRARKTNTRNDGVTGSLHINGLMVDSRVVPGNDTSGELRTYYANLSPGDIVDLALSPEGVANRSDGNDSASTRFWVSNVIPPDPVQPDGSPFIPRADLDDDGLLDDWEVENFGGIAEGPDDDFDSDGLSNLAEFERGTHPAEGDSDGDGFLDGDEVERNTDPADPASRLLADSVLEFSGEQGQDGWYHGYRNYTLDGGGDHYNPVSGFVEFEPSHWRGTQWRLVPGNDPWTSMRAESTHPNGTNSAPNEEHWTVRRWVPTDLEVTTPVAITWRARKTNTRNDGVTGSLHINGLMVDSRVIPGNDTSGEFRTYYANLSPGDIVDLALSPEGVANRSDGNDSASTRFWVSNVIPPDPVQPDGTPFVPFSGTPLIAQLGQDLNGEQPRDGMGNSVSMNAKGDRVAIGLPNSLNFSGSARVYQWSGTRWEQMAQTLEGAQTGAFFGISVSLSRSGDRLAVGAFGHEGQSGQVRVYEWAEDRWQQIGQALNGGPGPEWSGSSLSLSGDGSRVAIGAPRSSSNGELSGLVRIYDLVGNSWALAGQAIEGKAAGDQSGSSVALSLDGQRVAIGAPSSNDNGELAGQVRVYEFIRGQWAQLADDIDGDRVRDVSGSSVSLSRDGSRVAIGSPSQALNNLVEPGHVRVFELSAAGWSQVGPRIEGAADTDRFGARVSLSFDGERLAISATQNDANGEDSGRVRFYELSQGNWLQLGQDIAGGASFDNNGAGLSLSGNGFRAAIGAPGHDGNGLNSGEVRVYQLPGGAVSSLGAWLSSFSLAGFDALPLASPAEDGIPNLLKYAFNMNPTVSYTGDQRLLGPGTGESGLPVIRVTERNGEDRLQIEFVRRRNTDSPVYQPQVSDDLVDWQPLDTIPSVTEIDDQWERVVVDDLLPRDERGNRFVRVLIELAE